MADEEDDYLSDKFLLEATAAPLTAPKSYAERRKEAQRLATIKNEQNRQKSRRQLELESREEGLRRSLFERAQDEQASGQQNKALAMMMKMGFKPGDTLGQKYDDEPSTSNCVTLVTDKDVKADGEASASTGPSSSTKPLLPHRAEPLPLNEWTGKKGIGSRKRAASPTQSERLAKMTKMAEESDRESFRDRARQEYEERRAQGRLAPAQRTCVTLDEKAGREFNILWLNPHNPESFPEGFIDALDDTRLVAALQQQQVDDTIEGRLSARMRADALQPLAILDSDGPQPATKLEPSRSPHSQDDIKEATQFLQLSAKDRLQLVLDYLRQKYAYCFWCGVQYGDHEDMEANCPGPNEDDHD
ncbi:hypothetical protein AcW1_004500 [Taiwanofungus camphoratus]|nr:hypothetical protein AcW2_006496 [Antrodia cinnamomea]KAI0952392.1 hypothetical protein AcV7_008215 [Antrodia cinnamomea]KAI0959771.1 hypothetical protein AcW1_004500 [Antrodia cinnamomea]